LKNEWRFVQDVGMENKFQVQMMQILFDLNSSIFLFYGRKITCTKRNTCPYNVLGFPLALAKIGGTSYSSTK
jgi:hypothetical protein